MFNLKVEDRKESTTLGVVIASFKWPPKVKNGAKKKAQQFFCSEKQQTLQDSLAPISHFGGCLVDVVKLTSIIFIKVTGSV